MKDSEIETGRIEGPQVLKGGYVVDQSSFTEMAAQKMTGEAQRRPAQVRSLVEETREARVALAEAIQGIGDAIETFQPKSDEYVRELRTFVRAGVLELKNLQSTLADIRKFFLSDDHQAEVGRLKEFCDVCERLQKLKQDGTLESIIDAILKLELKQ